MQTSVLLTEKSVAKSCMPHLVLFCTEGSHLAFETNVPEAFQARSVHDMRSRVGCRRAFTGDHQGTYSTFTRISQGEWVQSAVNVEQYDCSPRCARKTASDAPAGPAPTTRTSTSMFLSIAKSGACILADPIVVLKPFRDHCQWERATAKVCLDSRPQFRALKDEKRTSTRPVPLREAHESQWPVQSSSLSAPRDCVGCGTAYHA